MKNIDVIETFIKEEGREKAKTEQEEQEERNILLNSFITGNELYTNLFYREYKQVNIKDILSQYIYELEQRITTEEKTQAQKTVASAIQRHFIG